MNYIVSTLKIVFRQLTWISTRFCPNIFLYYGIILFQSEEKSRNKNRLQSKILFPCVTFNLFSTTNLISFNWGNFWENNWVYQGRNFEIIETNCAPSHLTLIKLNGTWTGRQYVARWQELFEQVQPRFTVHCTIKGLLEGPRPIVEDIKINITTNINVGLEESSSA
jgi:hypothetical protein